MGTTATSWVEKSLLEFGICKSWIWIFHRLLQGTCSKNTSNSLGSIRLYKALKRRAANVSQQTGCTMSTRQGPLSILILLSLRLTTNLHSRTQVIYLFPVNIKVYTTDDYTHKLVHMCPPLHSLIQMRAHKEKHASF